MCVENRINYLIKNRCFKIIQQKAPLYNILILIEKKYIE